MVVYQFSKTEKYMELNVATLDKEALQDVSVARAQKELDDLDLRSPTRTYVTVSQVSRREYSLLFFLHLTRRPVEFYSRLPMKSTLLGSRGVH